MSSENQNDLFVLSKEELVQKYSQELHIRDDAYSRIVASTFEPSQNDIQDLEKAVQSGDFQSIHTLAHRLKGVYSNLRLIALSNPTEAIDALAKEEGGLEEMKQSLEELKKAFEVLKEKF